MTNISLETIAALRTDVAETCKHCGQSSASAVEIDPLDFLRGDSEMAGRISAHDWSGSPIGPPEFWPPPLTSHLRTVLTTALPACIFWGPENVYLYNDGLRLAADPTLPLGAPARDVGAEAWAVIGPQIEHIMGGGRAIWCENQLVPIIRDGRPFDVYWTYSCSPIGDPTAAFGVGGVLVLCTITTTSVLSERRIATEAARQRDLFQQSPSFMAVLQGPDHRFEFANAAYLTLVGDRAVIGHTVAEAIPEAVGQGFIDILNGVFESGTPYTAKGVKYVMQATPEGPSVSLFLNLTYQPIVGADDVVSGICVQGVDVTDLTMALQRLNAMARIDALTRLPNRMALIDSIQVAIGRLSSNGETFSLLYMDLDDFKLLNDHAGHAAGDEALREVASALRRSVRVEDMPSRLGGDEFVVLVRGNREQALTVAERVRQAVQARMMMRGWRVTASIGTATFERPPHGAEAALAIADTAMYAEKKAAKGQPHTLNS